VLDAIIAGVIVLLLITAFWLTRGGGGVSGGLDDPAAQAWSEYTPLRPPHHRPERGPGR
jgi:hypothetical protein